MTALQDVRIIDLSRLLPGPFCTQLLADLGADVVKIEDTDRGDYLRWMPPLAGRYSALFHAVNRNKRSVVLNLKVSSGRAAFLRLVERADVVVEGFRPGVIDRLGIGYATLRERNPRVILCSITGYGQDGPYRGRAGHDVNYAALAGVLSMTGCEPDTPVVPGVQMGDLGGGALPAAVAILAALHEREHTGQGRHCDVSMLDGLVSWMAPVAAAYQATGEVPGPGTYLLNGRHPCYRIYRCADGHLSLGALEPKFWRNFVGLIGLPDLAEAGLSSGDEAAAVAAQVQDVLLTRTRAEWARHFADAEVCCEPVLSIDEVFAHPQLVARERRDRLEPRRPAPEYGQHTQEVLGEVGYSEAELQTLLEEGATISPS